uniref:Uncharacterized protein n=1 Tax=Oryza rufipogon TaxID=4529 RepID=A0A0E0R766_ORYRU
MPTPAQLGWVFTRKGRESTRQHLQGGNGARRYRPNHQHRQTQRLSHRKAPQPGLEADSQKKGGAPRMKEA